MRVPLFGENLPSAGARLGVELLSQQGCSLLIPLFMRELPEVQHRPPGIDIVEAQVSPICKPGSIRPV